MKNLIICILAGVVFSLVIPGKSYSQFYKIYGYGTPEAGEKELVYWLSYIPSSDHTYYYFGEDVEREGLLAHSFEIEYALSNKFSVALYADFEQRQENLMMDIPTTRPFLRVTVDGVLNYLSLKAFRQDYLEKNVQVDMFDIGGCGCFLE